MPLETCAGDKSLDFVVSRLLHEEGKRSETLVKFINVMENALFATKPTSQKFKSRNKGNL